MRFLHILPLLPTMVYAMPLADGPPNPGPPQLDCVSWLMLVV
ncbi:unnamed protein product [Penicillium camemberti]|uniref:Str. FM013 n=1 Tax=Penicillium camemberti (strain FM 013) TaxID=1429867 RepID=A0A0G4PC18_PENC3|nr:unnamed protein product [Penicillium camemberti]